MIIIIENIRRLTVVFVPSDTYNLYVDAVRAIVMLKMLNIFYSMFGSIVV